MTDNQPKRKVNRAKARLQRREEGMEAQRKEAALEALSMPDLRAMETAQMHAKLSTMGLEEYNVSTDPHLDPTVALTRTDRSMQMGIAYIQPLLIS